MPRVIGLTGGIASGKSTVAKILRELGASVVDADEVARAVVEPGQPALADIVARFGASVLSREGELDRQRLGEIVFGDDEARRALNAITHPRIAAESQRRIANSNSEIVIYEAALIVENRLHESMAGLIVVSVSEAVQLDRLMARDQLDRPAALARLDAQLCLADKVAVATWVIDNSGTPEQTRAQTESLWTRQLQQEVPS